MTTKERAALRVLLIEDNPADAGLIEAALSELLGLANIKHVENMKAAEAFLGRSEPVDVILLDLALPDSNGLATLERATCAAPHLPIIVLTGSQNEALAIEALRNGAQDYLMKGDALPLPLARAIHHAVERKRLAEDRRQTEDSLRRSEERLRLALRAGRMATWDWHLPTGEVVWNDEHYRFLGYEPGSIKPDYEAWAGRVHPEDRDATERQLRQSMERRGDYCTEYRVVWPDATERWMEVRGHVEGDASGQPVRSYGVMIDITERKQAEKAKEKAIADAVTEKSRLEAVMQALPIAVAITDAEGGNRHSNLLYEEIWGSPRPAVGSIEDYAAYHAWWADTGEPVLPEQWASAQAVQEGRTIVGQVMEIQRFDGRRAFVLNSGAPIRDADGTIVGSAVAIQDITAIKHAEEALRLSESRYRTLHESLRDAFVQVDMGGRIVECNELYCQMLGYTRQEMRELSYQVVTPERWHEYEDRIVREQIIARGYSDVYEKEYRRKDGTVFPVELRTILSRDAEGRPVAMWGLVRDITERKRAEGAVAAAQRQIQSIIDNTTAIVYAFDLQGRFLLANTAVAELLNSTPEQMIGKRRHEFMPKDDADWHEANDRQVFKAGRAMEFEEYSQLKGRSITWLTTKFPLRDVRGTIYAVAGISTDISERKLAEESLVQAKAAAEAANIAKGQFLANVSHELRTPMNAILGMIDLALKRQVDPTTTDFLKTARESADLLLALLDDLLDATKIDAGRLDLELRPFSLRRILDQTAQVLAVRASERGISFSCQIPPEVPDALVGDQVRLRQVLLNLAGNGIKFTEHGDVSVSVCVHSQGTDEACLQFAVRDTGIGIPKRDIEHIFHPFAQADASTSRKYGGTGLGLSICSRLVAMMGGRIWVESDVGKGSTFYFTVQLPLATEYPTEPRLTPVVPARRVVTLRILVVEDNPANQKLAACILQDRGHMVEIAENGLEAICSTKQNRYDAILMDVQMPGMNGWEATAAIRIGERGGRRAPIIAMTAHAMKEDRERCLAAGMDGYLSKPIDPDEMIELVEKLADASLTES